MREMVPVVRWLLALATQRLAPRVPFQLLLAPENLRLVVNCLLLAVHRELVVISTSKLVPALLSPLAL
jgi:hypothetical protein